MASVKIGDKYSEPFKPNKGVKQGCVLSPLLFNIFLVDLQNNLDNCGDNVKLDDNKEISCLIWADDILILSESEKGLQSKLNKLEIFCANNKLSVNTDKTECMIFNKTGRLMNRKFLFNGIPLNNVRKYKYLGFLVTPSGEIRSGLEDLRIRALKALMIIKKALGTHFQHNIQNSIHLYNYMVRPILLYASDFWGCLKHPKNSPIERLHNMFCKQLLGVQKQTNTIGVLLELGMVPITLLANKAATKNWDRIRRNKGNNLLSASYKNALQENLPWTSSIKTLLESNGILQSFLTVNDPIRGIQPKPIDNLIYQRLIDQFHQNSFENIKESSKLKTYSTFKNEIGMEKYLTEIINIKYRCAMTKLRLSNHSLSIETGRHTKTERQNRLCPFCHRIIEDEIHFLIQCPTYKELRDKLLSPHILNNITLCDEDKFTNILKQKELKLTAKYIYEAFEIRKITLDVRSVMDDMMAKIEANP